MTQDRMPANRQRFAEPETIPTNCDPATTLAFCRAILDTRHPRPRRDARIEIFGVALLAPALAAIAALMLLALLGYFVVWLCIVGILFAFTIIADLVHHWWHWPRTIGTSNRRALDYPVH